MAEEVTEKEKGRGMVVVLAQSFEYGCSRFEAGMASALFLVQRFSHEFGLAEVEVKAYALSRQLSPGRHCAQEMASVLSLFLESQLLGRVIALVVGLAIAPARQLWSGSSQQVEGKEIFGQPSRFSQLSHIVLGMEIGVSALVW
jgi:hypothetical protein